uniref:alanine-tRNA synthetase second additional domain-containing protein n=1 Tax=Desulforadius tongensis TaxID=1216062 RepID=UPI0019575700|nr:alanine-tRNA synthetase second additional domain-containing protein [Desulforadius tongensis]
MHAVYFAPRGRRRLMALGSSISQRYLSPLDKLIGFIGDAGAGKSLLIRGMFPGLELTNDDDGINVRPLPLLEDARRGFFRSRTYHVDMRFETAFTQPYEIAEAVMQAINSEHRVVVEHFDLLYPYLKYNSSILLGIGEEVIVTRPNIFGPEPQEIVDIVFESLIYRKMAHSAEDITGFVLREMGLEEAVEHDDLKHGFVLEFNEKPNIDLEEVEKQVKEIIQKKRSIHYYDDHHIRVGDNIIKCTGPRLHVKNTGEVENFRLVKEFKWDPINKLYTIAGLVGPVREEETPDHPNQFHLITGEKKRATKTNF